MIRCSRTDADGGKSKKKSSSSSLICRKTRTNPKNKRGLRLLGKFTISQGFPKRMQMAAKGSRRLMMIRQPFAAKPLWQKQEETQEFLPDLL